jgi:hypothetical protein
MIRTFQIIRVKDFEDAGLFVCHTAEIVEAILFTPFGQVAQPSGRFVRDEFKLDKIG